MGRLDKVYSNGSYNKLKIGLRQNQINYELRAGRHEIQTRCVTIVRSRNVKTLSWRTLKFAFFIITVFYKDPVENEK